MVVTGFFAQCKCLCLQDKQLLLLHVGYQGSFGCWKCTLFHPFPCTQQNISTQPRVSVSLLQWQVGFTLIWFKKYGLNVKNINVYVSSLISPWVQQTSHNLHLWYWNFFFYSLISSRENSAFAFFAAAKANHYNFSFLIAPSTHHCCVDRGGVVWEACATPLHIMWPCVTICVGLVIRPARLSQYMGSLVVYDMSTRLCWFSWL